MDINVKIDIPALDRIADALIAHLAADGAPAAATPKKVEPKAATPKDETKKEEPAPETKVDPESPAEEPLVETEGEPVTYADVKDRILKVTSAKGRDAAVALLGKFGAAKGQDVPEERYGDFVAEADKVLG